MASPAGSHFLMTVWAMDEHKKIEHHHVKKDCFALGKKQESGKIDDHVEESLLCKTVSGSTKSQKACRLKEKCQKSCNPKTMWRYNIFVNKTIDESSLRISSVICR